MTFQRVDSDISAQRERWGARIKVAEIMLQKDENEVWLTGSEVKSIYEYFLKIGAIRND